MVRPGRSILRQRRAPARDPTADLAEPDYSYPLRAQLAVRKARRIAILLRLVRERPRARDQLRVPLRNPPQAGQRQGQRRLGHRLGPRARRVDYGDLARREIVQRQAASRVVRVAADRLETRRLTNTLLGELAAEER